MCAVAGFLTAGMLASCKKDIEPAAEPANTRVPDISHSIADRDARPMVLGAKKQNPYSVENMQIALDSLLSNSQNDEYVSSLKSLENIEIVPTDLYVRFLARDSTSDRLLMSDTALTLFSWPLDYEITVEGDYYHDPTVAGPYTWQYTTVKPGYTPPQGVRYEILSQLYIIEHDPTYTEELIEDTASGLKSSFTGISANAAQLLTAVSYNLCGYEIADDEASAQSGLKMTIENCSKLCVGIGKHYTCIPDCNTKYYPDGRIQLKVSDTQVLPLAGVKVRIWRGFTYADATTDGLGYYQCEARFYKQLYDPYLRYHIVFYGRNGNNTWNISQSLSGATTPTTASYNTGQHSPDGHSVTIHDGSNYWGIAVQHKAIYDYVNSSINDGITLPPKHIEVASDENSDLTSSAPLKETRLGWLNTLIFPDLILKSRNNYNYFYRLTSLAYHELTHASHLQRIRNEKGAAWANEYWRALASIESYHFIADKNCYGKKGDYNWQMIALAEGWANYREWRMSKDYLGYSSISKLSWTDSPYSPSSYSDLSLGFPVYYSKMFEKLEKIGCSQTSIEKSLCTYSVTRFKDDLSGIYPNSKVKISEIVTPYE